MKDKTDPDMSESMQTLEEHTRSDYKYGFTSNIDSDTFPKGLSEDVVRAISMKKNEPEWLTEWRLKAYRHWLTMTEPNWAHLHHPRIDYQSISYFSATAWAAASKTTSRSAPP